jgi:hypothetical protein
MPRQNQGKAMHKSRLLPFLVLFFVGCDKPAQPTQPATAEPSAAPATAPSPGVVTVAAEGTRFDPAVRAEQLPAGAWYCDMGTVHFARMTEGDGKCPICHMKLKHKTP